MTTTTITGAIEVGAKLATLEGIVQRLSAVSMLPSSSIGDVPVTAVVDAAVDSAQFLPDLQERLDSAAALVDASQLDLDAAADAVEAAEALAQQAGLDAQEAADEALAEAQKALEQGGSGNEHEDRAPTADDAAALPDGTLWFQEDSGGSTTNIYRLSKPEGQSGTWVPIVLTGGVFGSIDAGQIDTGYLAADRIAAETITGAMIHADAITSRELGADSVLARNIKAGEVAAVHIAASTIDATKIQVGTLTGALFQAGAITAREIAAGSVTAQSLAADAIDGKTISGVNITGGSLATAVQTGVGYLRAYGPGVTFYNTNGTARGYLTADSDRMRLTGTSPTATSIVSVGRIAFTSIPGTGGGAGQSFTSDVTMGDLYLSGGDLFVGSGQIRDTYSKVPMTGVGGAGTTGRRIMGAALGLVLNDGLSNPNTSANILDVVLAGSDSKAEVNAHRFRDATSGALLAIPYVIAAGQASYANTITSGSAVNIDITFPSGRFSRAPRVVATASNPRLIVGIESITASGCTLRLGNWSGASVTGGVTVDWQAVQISSGNSNGGVGGVS